MSVKATFAEYTDLCDGTAYGKNILDMPTVAIEALNELMDGAEVDMNGGDNHPDNVWVNGISCLTDEDMVANVAGLAVADWVPDPAAWVEAHAEEVERWCEDNGTLLAHVGMDWWYLQ